MIKGVLTYVYWDVARKKILFQLKEDIVFVLSNNEIITVPAQYITDFATVPKFARWLIAQVDRHNIAAILHDYMYDTRHNNDRKFADDEFLRVMRKYNVPLWKRSIMYFAVRVGAQNYWKY